MMSSIVGVMADGGHARAVTTGRLRSRVPKLPGGKSLGVSTIRCGTRRRTMNGNKTERKPTSDDGQRKSSRRLENLFAFLILSLA